MGWEDSQGLYYVHTPHCMEYYLGSIAHSLASPMKKINASFDM